MAKAPKKQQYPFYTAFLSDFVEYTASDIQKIRKTAMLFTLPAYSGMRQHLLRCQGIGVNDYSLTLDAPDDGISFHSTCICSTLGFCNVRVKF